MSCFFVVCCVVAKASMFSGRSLLLVANGIVFGAWSFGLVVLAVQQYFDGISVS